MNEDINIAEILKDAPKGTTLWSPLCGNCELICIGGEKDWIYCKCIEEIKEDVHFDKEGKFFSNDNAECVLFPSENNRDWSTFKTPWKHKNFEPFQKVLIASGVSELWEPDMYCYYNDKRKRHICMIHSAFDNDIIPYECNEDKVGKHI